MELDVKLSAFQSRGCPTISDWGFRQTRTPQALELLGSSDTMQGNVAEVLVAVIDSGIDLNHPFLRDRIFVNEEELNGLDGVDDDQNGKSTILKTFQTSFKLMFHSFAQVLCFQALLVVRCFIGVSSVISWVSCHCPVSLSCQCNHTTFVNPNPLACWQERGFWHTMMPSRKV